MKIYDKDIRGLLLREIASRSDYVADPTCIVVPEMDICFGCARIDIAVINGQINGYEIKSEQDNLKRLASQIDFYNKMFDTITLVVSHRHCAKAAGIIPKWWGLYSIVKHKGYASLKIVRNPRPNPHVEGFALTQLLWKEELHELLASNGLSKGIRSKTRYELGKMAAERIGYAELALFVRSKLKNRKNWRALPIRQLCDDLHLLQPSQCCSLAL